jgi:hypothetical protein
LAVLTYEGRGFTNAGPSIGNGVSLSASLASGFFVILVALTALSLILKYGTRLFLPVLTAQSLLLAAAGERSPVFLDAITLIQLLAHAGYRLPRLQALAAVSLTVLTVLALTEARAAQGRALYTQDSSLGARIARLASALTDDTGGQGPGLIAQDADRLDGTDFAGAIRQCSRLFGPRNFSTRANREGRICAAEYRSSVGAARRCDLDMVLVRRHGSQRWDKASCSTADRCNRCLRSPGPTGHAHSISLFRELVTPDSI